MNKEKTTKNNQHPTRKEAIEYLIKAGLDKKKLSRKSDDVIAFVYDAQLRREKSEVSK